MEEVKEKRMRSWIWLKRSMSAIIFALGFIIGCMFIYWAVEYYVYNTFDGDRYSITKIQAGSGDTLNVWKLDHRTGGLEFCSKSNDRFGYLVCVPSINAKEYYKILQEQGRISQDQQTQEQKRIDIPNLPPHDENSDATDKAPSVVEKDAKEPVKEGTPAVPATPKR